MKNILSLLFALVSIAAYSQSGFSSVFLRVTDSTTYVNSSNTTSKHSAGYADIWYSTASQLFWHWNGSAYELFGTGTGNDKPQRLYWTTKTADYTPVIADTTVNRAFRMKHATGITFTIPTHASQPFKEGQTFVMAQDSIGPVTIAFASGVAQKGTTILTTQYIGQLVVVSKYNTTNTWVVSISDTTGTAGTGIVETIVAGTNITVDATDPANPIVSGSIAALSGNGLYVDGDSLAVGSVVHKDIDFRSYNNKRFSYYGTDGGDSSVYLQIKGGSSFYGSVSNGLYGGIISAQPSHVQISAYSPTGVVTYEADDSGLTALLDSLGDVDYSIKKGFFEIKSGTPLTSRIRIENDGSWNLGGSNGTSGQVFTSQGASSPPIWTTPSGTYTPTLTNTTNVSASTAYVTGWYRVGSMVTVFGKVDIDATLAASSATELGVSLPVASNMTGEQDLGGTAISDSIASLAARIKGDATNDRAAIVFKAISLTNDSYSFEFSYQVK